jgi:hypothetical protein
MGNEPITTIGVDGINMNSPEIIEEEYKIAFAQIDSTITS